MLPIVCTEATNILFGQIFGVSTQDIVVLSIIALGVLVVMAVIHRPLQFFSSIDPEVAVACGVNTRLVGFIFVFVFVFALALTVTEASQIVGTLLVLSLAITPAAAARHLSSSPRRVTGLSIVLALIAADGGLLAGLQFSSVKASVFISGFSFLIYLIARLIGYLRGRARHGGALVKQA